MLIMITAWYPPHKAIEIGKIYLKQPRKIPYITKWRAFNAAGGLNGFKQYHLIYTEKGKGEEAILELDKYFLPFLQVEGFNLLIEPLVGVSDSFKAAGMTWEK